MAETFFFYDLETSGIDPAAQRIMQFAGQRTDRQLKPVGEPVDVLIKLTDEILPDPEAILLHGLTPQRCAEEGISEKELLELLEKSVFRPETITVGYNNLRFDDQFLRYTMYRNLADPYAWQWMDKRSRWDLLDVGRMARALRPEGIKWPLNEERKASHRLVDLARINHIIHVNAHDALSDVQATIGLAGLIREKQPKLFDFLLENRSKRAVARIVNLKEPYPFVYTSGRYPSETLKTTIAIAVCQDPANQDAVLVYDLRYDPESYERLDAKAIQGLLTARYDKDKPRPVFPIKSLGLNRCPTVAPLAVLDAKSKRRLALDMTEINANLESLKRFPHLIDNASSAFRKMAERVPIDDVDYQLFEGFYDDQDKTNLTRARQMTADQLASYQPQFHDERIEKLIFRYRARNFRSSLTTEESVRWDEWRQQRFVEGAKGQLTMESYFKRLDDLAKSSEKSFLIEEMRLWGQSVLPSIG